MKEFLYVFYYITVLLTLACIPLLRVLVSDILEGVRDRKNRRALKREIKWAEKEMLKNKEGKDKRCNPLTARQNVYWYNYTEK